MPYGVRRGVKSPGEFGIADIFGLGLAGSAGIIFALVTDFQQQGEGAAIYTINQWVVALATMLGFTTIPLWIVAIGLIVTGAVSIFYFQPITRQGAFAQGFGLLAVVMTAIPANLSGGIESVLHADDLPGLEPVSMSRDAALGSGVGGGMIVPAVFTSADAQIYKIQATRADHKYDVHLSINFENGLADDIDSLIRKGWIRGRLHNQETGQTWNLFRTSGGTVHQDGNALHIHAGVPAQSDTAMLWVRIESVNYAIEERSKEATLGETLYWDIELHPSTTPLFLQRLNKSYWF